MTQSGAPGKSHGTEQAMARFGEREDRLHERALLYPRATQTFIFYFPSFHACPLPAPFFRQGLFIQPRLALNS